MSTSPRKYRKKPVVIEAMQYLPNDVENCAAIHAWLGLPEHDPMDGECGVAGIGIDTLEGQMWVSVGDFIIKGVQGEFYPCKPDIFAATYDEVPS